PEFDPSQGWTRRLYWNRLERAAAVINQACPGGPAIVALQELENRNVLLTLRDRFLPMGGYREAILVPTPGSAVNVGFLSRLPVLRTAVLDPPVADDEVLRACLEIEVEVGGRRLVVLNNHWKSRPPEVRSTEVWRRAQAAVLNRRLAELSQRPDRPGILVVGDFNTDLAGNAQLAGDLPALVRSLNGRADRPQLCLGQSDNDLVLEDVWDRLTEPGSYWFRGRWSRLDHVLLTGGFKPGGAWNVGHAAVVQLAAQRAGDGSPRAWSQRDVAGISDHFPLIVRLELTPGRAGRAPVVDHPAGPAGLGRAD
ncbi:MAG: endonuclease/exonuclease/phosphatase family protein, partial [Desulfovibrionaceae bacterium]|nr:endonuclease/exonuclease/phosphatase family protein [Desulfovibrionaceae bacterium]